MHEDTTPPQSHFLNLPFEIRLQIYELFATVPPLEPFQERFNDHFIAVWARRNLMLSTTIKVHTPKELHELNPQRFKYGPFTGKHIEKKFVRPEACCTLAEFDHHFLKRLQPYKICNIRKLEYNGPTWFINSTDSTSTHALDLYVDSAALRSLGRILRSYKSIMTSLSEVVLGYVWPFSPDSRSWPSQSSTDPNFEAKEVWRNAASSGNWAGTIRAMQSSTRSGIFRGWGIEKEVAIIIWRLSHRAYSIKEAKVTFRKAQSSQDLPLADQVVPQLHIEWSRY
ncbi:hypothetical protein PV05_01726 [Exophiala xenobiotica]|uniref:Uncharacterized protein n=1 Tax=Exophiala xenobiotica TaxID=348802 RepID=A0A0D2C9J2_9EURO|nr:uncharacterized protein PV05_01726 [Exophiala xenobiotica]KIW61626.1 hypothetical protein PV05_01726 [Exophiala xenobiotica]